MNIQNDSKQNDFQEKSQRHPKFYIALLVCMAAVSVAGWSTYKTVKEFITPPKSSSPRISKPKEKSILKKTGKNSILESDAQGETESNDKKGGSAIPYGKKSESAGKLNRVAANEAKPQNNESDGTEDEESKAVWAEKKNETAGISYPTEKGSIAKEFSGETPVYSQTLCDWRVHEGTDFKAEKGSSIKSITSGVVTDIYNDSSYGTTVVVSHDGGFTAYYSGLEEKLIVKKGDKIKSGQELGNLGEIPCESLDEPHLHLAINKEGKFIDPLLVIEKEG